MTSLLRSRGAARVGAGPGSVAAARGAAQVVRRWLAAFAVLLLGPLLVRLLVGGPAPLGATLTDLTGLFALSALVCTFVLVCRMRVLSGAAGITALQAAHRATGVLAAGGVLLHIAVAVAADLDTVILLTWAGAPRIRAAGAATAALACVIVLGLLRRRARQDYELWRWAHVVLGVTAVTLSALHVQLVGDLVRHPVMRWVLVAMAVVLAAALLHRWLVTLRSSEYVVREVRHESHSVCTLVLDPQGSPLRFAPGQFAWLRLARSGGAEQHPFTIASSAAGGECAFTVRSTGDFGTVLRNLPPGTRVWLDGPYGSCSVDLLPQPASGVAMIAADVGITPMLSMVRTLADRHDPRPLLLVRAAREPQELLFRDELGYLAQRLDLTVVEVVRHPPPGWAGAVGEVAAPLLRSVLPPRAQRSALDYFVCGPPDFLGGVAHDLMELGVPEHRIHIEQF